MFVLLCKFKHSLYLLSRQKPHSQVCIFKETISRSGQGLWGCTLSVAYVSHSNLISPDAGMDSNSKRRMAPCLGHGRNYRSVLEIRPLWEMCICLLLL